MERNARHAGKSGRQRTHFEGIFSVQLQVNFPDLFRDLFQIIGYQNVLAGRRGKQTQLLRMEWLVNKRRAYELFERQRKNRNVLSVLHFNNSMPAAAGSN